MKLKSLSSCYQFYFSSYKWSVSFYNETFLIKLTNLWSLRITIDYMLSLFPLTLGSTKIFKNYVTFRHSHQVKEIHFSWCFFFKCLDYHFYGAVVKMMNKNVWKLFLKCTQLTKSYMTALLILNRKNPFFF